MKSEETSGDALEGWLGKEEEPGGLGTCAGGSVEAPDPPMMMTFGWMMGREEVGRLEECLGKEDGVGAEQRDPEGFATSLEVLVLVCGTLAGGSQTVSHSASVGEAWDEGPAGEGEV